jgi:gliding motility-associated lipoprotein GldH
MNRIILLLVSIILTLSSCVTSPYYQKSFDIPANQWTPNFKPNFVIDIDDTNVYYNVHFLIRHTNLYAFANIWLWVYVKQPGETSFTKTRIEIPLANPQGRWMGQGMGELYEQRRMIVLNKEEIPITDDLISIAEDNVPNLFHKKGRYEIRFEQNMRTQSLPDVLQIGLRVEKSSVRKKTSLSTKS